MPTISAIIATSYGLLIVYVWSGSILAMGYTGSLVTYLLGV